jgi:TOMM system kinase/cyclase fusion protein
MMSKDKASGGGTEWPGQRGTDSETAVTAEPNGDEMATRKPEETPQRFVGRVLSGRYRIDVHLGSGGFGDVFRAIQEKTGQLVAIKLLRPRYGRGAPSLERQLARFRREMRVCAELHHAHIVRLIDSGETDGEILFSVFEYVPGTTLAELLREKGALTVRTTIELMSQVLDALICAHGKGIIHRDLKPNNIMVSTTGSRPQTTVLDFGISAFREGMLMDEFKSLTVTREVLGTPSYAAPEQLRGETASVKSDLYAWGLVFLECLTGRRVFDGGSSLEIAYRQLAADPVPLPAHLQKHWLGTLLRWVLEKDVARRAGDGSLLMERLLEKRPLGDLVDAQGYLLILGEAGEAESAGSPAGSEPRTSAATGTLPGGERRQITALCCNIALSASAHQAAPELLDQMLRDTLTACLQIATRFGGYPASNLGGQVLIYFGFPRASDTDARRCGIVALEIAHELRRRAGEMGAVPVQVQIGIHTGMVTTSGMDARSPSPVVGMTPTRAVQLAAEAPVNGILVSEESWKYLGPTFELRAITTTRAEKAYQMVAESRAESAAPGLPSTPFVGRQRELDELAAAWERARAGQGSTVVVLGEAGIGKSRLAREMRAQLHARGSGWIEARCLPENEISALRPITDLLVHELNLSSPEPAENARRLEASLADLGFPTVEAMPLLCLWLGLPLAEPHAPLAHSPQKQKAMLLEQLAQLVAAIAERKCAAVLIEDLHWADPTTNELVSLLVERVAGRRALLILTMRPEPVRAWPQAGARVLDLKSLERAEVEQIVDALTSGRELPRKLVSDVVDRADGIPLFVEEIVHYLEDADVLRGTASGNLGQAEVPGKLRDLLTGRLDRLGPARETAQIAAAIGREFDYRLLAGVVGGDEARLLADLEKMISADLVVRRRHLDNPVYMFRHALIRDAAYESLLRAAQQQLHRKIAETLSARFPEMAEAQPELMASHYERGGLVPQAIDEWLRAGRRGLDTANNRETIAHMRRALALLPGIPEETERLRRELDLQLTLVPALSAIEGWAAPSVGAASSRARDLCEALGDHEKLFPALWGLWTYQFVGGHLAPALETARRTLQMAEATKVPLLQIAARHAVGFTQFFRGELAEAERIAAEVLAMFDLELEKRLARTFQLSSTVACAYFRAGSLWMQGRVEEAEAGFTFMHDLARELDHLPSIAGAMGFAAISRHHQQDVRRTRDLAERLSLLANEQGFEIWKAFSPVFLAWVRTREEDRDQGIRDLEKTIEQFKLGGNRLLLVSIAAMLGDGLLLAGRREDCLRVVAEGLMDAADRDEHLFESELHRLRAEALRPTDPAESEASFLAALRIARGQQAHSLALRAATGLARLLRGQGRNSEACQLLQSEHGGIAPGDQTEDIQAARQLLAEISLEQQRPNPA